MFSCCRPRLIRWTLAACAGGALLGCKEDEARPGALGDCNDDGCASTRRNGNAYVGGGNGTAGNAGSAAVEGGAGSSSSANARTLTGTIAVVVQPDLTASS